MAISGNIKINVGLPNESSNSDSLFTAFNKINTNFDTIFGNAAGQVVAGNGISVIQNPNTTTISANLIAGNNILLTNSNGAIIIDSVGGNGNGSITAVLAGSGLSGGGVSGNITLSLANSNVSPATYTNPTIVVDQFGRITSASNNTTAGTVTSVGLAAGAGISVAGGPITSNGTITVTNTGVTRLNAGAGISVTANTGNITISAPNVGGTVTSVGVSSNTLTVSNTPITSFGNINIELPNSITLSGNIVANNLGNISSYNLDGNSANVLHGDGSWSADVTNYGNSNVANYLPTYTGNFSAGNADLGNTANANYFVGNGYFLTGLNLSNAVANNANYAAFAGNVTIANQPNITSVGNLTSLNVIGNTGNVYISSDSNTSTVIQFLPNGTTYFKANTYHPNNSTNYPRQQTIRNRGNITNPTTAVNGDRISSRIASIYNGTIVQDVAFEHMLVTNVTSGSNVYSGGEWRLFTGNPFGSNLANATDQSGVNSVRLTNSGSLQLLQGTPTTTTTSALQITNFGANSSDLARAGGITQRRARGNNQTQLSVQPNDQLGHMSYIGYNGTSYYETVIAQLRAVVDSSYIANSANIPTNMQIVACDNVGNQKVTSFYGNGNVDIQGYIFATGANLGNVGNVNITGGSNGQVLTTNGSGNLSWTTLSGGAANTANTVTDNAQPNITSVGTLTSLSVSGNITAGNILANTKIESNTILANSMLTVSSYGQEGLEIIPGSAGGTSGVQLQNFNRTTGLYGNMYYDAKNHIFRDQTTERFRILPSGAISTGTSGNNTGNSGQVLTSQGASSPPIWSDVTATTAGTVTTNAQPNITSVGNLTSITVNGASNLGPVGNVTITGGSNGQVLTTDGSGGLSWTTVSGGGGNISTISNGTSNINIATSNGPINFVANGSNRMTLHANGGFEINSADPNVAPLTVSSRGFGFGTGLVLRGASDTGTNEVLRLESTNSNSGAEELTISSRFSNGISGTQIIVNGTVANPPFRITTANPGLGQVLALSISNQQNVAINSGNLSVNQNVAVNGGIVRFVNRTFSTLSAPVTSGANIDISGPGCRAFITDANLAAAGNFGAIVSGGGSNSVPVFSDGTNWRIG